MAKFIGSDLHTGNWGEDYFIEKLMEYLDDTSGEVFNLERDHLRDVEKQISDEVTQIHKSPDYVSQYAVGDYDDGGLSYAKSVSKIRYSKRLEELSEYTPKPYSYRVDIATDGITETYYIGATDIFLNGKQQVISANSDFGHDLINYRTIKIKKKGKEYNIKLSRQFDINNAILYGYVNLRTDEDIIFKSGITDPFLVRVLNMRKKQHNLTDIFVTIQENQNRIVNTPFNRNIIVQGCAGSGKTMVLLHRLSSLNYKEKNFSFSKNALILTPNDQFTLHIKGLAEELQIGGIQRASVEQYYTDMLMCYSPDFKLDGKVSSEMIVRQAFVDYIYSDQFLTDFDKAYSAIVVKRNSLVPILNDLAQAMGQPTRNIDTSDNKRVVQQIQFAVDALRVLVEKKEAEISASIEEYQKLISRKQFLSDKFQLLGKTNASVVEDCIPRVYYKIGAHLSERQYKISGLKDNIERLNAEKIEVERRILPLGKREKIEEINKQIITAERTLNTENRRNEEELPILSKPTKDLSDEEAIAWMRRVMLIIPEVRDEVRLCDNMLEENNKVIEELTGIDSRIDAANRRVKENTALRYSEDVKKAIVYLDSEARKYTMLNMYQLVFDQATSLFRENNNIKEPQGKYHRYDLYARLIFAMRFFGDALGDTQFMCIDEGQDLAFNEYRLLFNLNQHRVVFNIFGDTNQLMKLGRGISDWTKLKRTLRAEEYSLNENYRNTNQITRFCNSSFGMKVTQTGVDGVNVREIPRKELESELAALNVTSERIAILVSRGVQKGRYLKKELLPPPIINIIGDEIGNGRISLMYVDEVKGIEFDKAYVVGNKMSRNEKYIAYTRALSELILVVDNQVVEYDDGSSQDAYDRRPRTQTQAEKTNSKKGILNYKTKRKKTEKTSRTITKTQTVTQTEQIENNGREQLKYETEKTDIPSLKPADSQIIGSVEHENINEDHAVDHQDDTSYSSLEDAVSEVKKIPHISSALKVLSKGYVEITATGVLSGTYYLVPYNGKLRTYTTKKTTSMYIPQMRSGKETKVPVSVVEEECVVFITKELYKIYEKALNRL